MIALCIILFMDALHAPALTNAGFAFLSPATTNDLLVLGAATSVTLGVAALGLAAAARRISVTRVERNSLWQKFRQ
jgi:hypothetical protein